MEDKITYKELAERLADAFVDRANFYCRSFSETVELEAENYTVYMDVKATHERVLVDNETRYTPANYRDDWTGYVTDIAVIDDCDQPVDMIQWLGGRKETLCSIVEDMFNNQIND